MSSRCYPGVTPVLPLCYPLFSPVRRSRCSSACCGCGRVSVASGGGHCRCPGVTPVCYPGVTPVLPRCYPLFSPARRSRCSSACCGCGRVSAASGGGRYRCAAEDAAPAEDHWPEPSGWPQLPPHTDGERVRVRLIRQRPF